MSKIQTLLQVTPKDTFYNSKKDVIENSNQMHKELFERDRELYTYLLYFTNSTYYSKSRIITSLLSNSLYLEKPEVLENLLKYEDALIHYALFNENATHAIKMLLQLKGDKINNSRTTNIILDYIFNRGNSDFLCIKYRNKIKQLLIHALGLSTINKILSGTAEGKKLFKKHIEKYNNPYAKEIFKFVCGKVSDLNEDKCESQYIKDYIKAEKEFSSQSFNHRNLQGTSLPVEVLIGFNNYYKRYLDIAIIMGLGKASDKQKIQMQNAVKKASNETVEIKIDFTKYSIVDLYKYLLNKEDLDAVERDNILSIINMKAKEIAENNPDFNPINTLGEQAAVILDLSNSTSGSAENPNAPLYKNLLLSKILFSYPEMKDTMRYFIGGNFDSDRMVYSPDGDTNIAEKLIRAVAEGYKKVIILSDGFENVGSTEDAYLKLKEFCPELSVMHFNPVFSPKDYSCKKLSEEFTTIPFNNEQDLSNMTLFALLSEDESKFKAVLKEKIDKEILKGE